MDDQGFWQLISRLDWKRTGNDALVIKPVVDALAEMDGTEIRAFQEILAKKLFALDGRAWAREAGSMIWWGEPDRLSQDSFLYARCAVVANGQAFYDAVLANPSKMPNNMEFESLIYIARRAEEKKHGHSDGIETQVSFETFSNRAGWS
jgi:hypothetical protein